MRHPRTYKNLRRKIKDNRNCVNAYATDGTMFGKEPIKLKFLEDGSTKKLYSPYDLRLETLVPKGIITAETINDPEGLLNVKKVNSTRNRISTALNWLNKNFNLIRKV